MGLGIVGLGRVETMITGNIRFGQEAGGATMDTAGAHLLCAFRILDGTITNSIWMTTTTQERTRSTPIISSAIDRCDDDYESRRHHVAPSPLIGHLQPHIM